MTAREVELSGGAPWGFRMHGGADHNQPLRISRVNPGRKASLGGIREGDVISSINGRPTRTMSNADAHAMLRSAGPVLKLGLNEDREMSPRRRSIGKGTELKRPSQLIAEACSGEATPQAPVYATIRPSQLPQRGPSSSPLRSSLNSLPGALNSTHLVKSVVLNDEPLKFHPTNPFYTTLPSNYSRLPVPNCRLSFSSLDRNKSKDTRSNIFNNYKESISPTTHSKTLDSGHTSLPYSNYNNIETTNGYNCNESKTNYDKKGYYSYNEKNNPYHSESLPSNRKNPFETKRNSDPFEKYLRNKSEMNGKCEYDGTIPCSVSDNDFRSKEEITKRSTITEHKINEVEEVKTIKKIVLNGYGHSTDTKREMNFKSSSPVKKSNVNDFDYNQFQTIKNCSEHLLPKTEYSFESPTLPRSNYFNSSFKEKVEKIHIPSKKENQLTHENYKSPSAETPENEPVTLKPPVKASNTPTVTLQSPTKRE